MAKKMYVEEVGKIVQLLEPLESEERLRIISASLTLLGETSLSLASRAGGDNLVDDENTIDLPPRARTWMKQYGVTVEQIAQVFHLDDDGAEIIVAAIPGKNKKEQTFNAYVLTGIASLLATGDSSFDDKAARKLCENSGCYDSANHSAYMKRRGNEITGSKDKGWKLTSPGVKRGAELVRESSE